jgi:hypothetical protein
MIRGMSRKRPAWLQNWLKRHQNPLSRRLHYIGIPLTIAAVVVAAAQLWLWRWDLWWRPAALLGAGYLLQYIGHRVEGNDLGEVILVKRLLGKPYQAVSPRYAGNVGQVEPATAGDTCHENRT